ncbi:hypothetical protein AMJ44_11695 [candidate division WOR-1 bacterium DG_54_3]|uniref:Fibronectin type-III domain-containing protein n=1 Tax=candidate division WOR-1 bacterium DG_54_3 TaxID=1703775 RepID=A0A0S7XR60_UNCSA|nr:MAG: hypothetical protein AMJ44_11695 [candidate division WOR-1 bacterium DG_54_3]
MSYKGLKILIVLIGILSIAAGASLAQVEYGKLSFTDGTYPDPNALTFVSYVNGADDYIITERTVDGYKLNGSGVGVWSVNTSNFIDENAAASGTFHIQFQVNGKGKKGTLNITAAGTQRTDFVLDQNAALSAPTLNVSSGDGRATLTWGPVSGATSYRLYRAERDDGYFVRIPGNVTSPHPDSGLVNDTTYYYILVASDGTNLSAHSDVVDATPQAGANSAPVVSNIPNQSINEGESFTAINLDNYVTDSDNADSEITWTYSGNNQLTVSIANRVATISVPSADWVGAETITFTATDPGNLSDSDGATFSVVNAVYNAPSANDVNISTSYNTPVQITLDATDIDGDILTYSIVDNPSNGTLGAISGNQVTYTPNPDYSGVDSFTFRAHDGQAYSNTATVSITVSASSNHPPIANNQSVITDEDVPVVITLTADDADGDSLTYAVASNPSHGSLSGAAPNLTYMPSTNYNGSDSFTFKVNDGTEDSNIAIINITVRPVDEPAVLTSITLFAEADTVAAGGTINLTVTAAYDDNSTGDITNSVDQWEVNGGGLVSANGVYTAPPTKGEVTIRARKGDKYSNTLAINVIYEPSEIVVDLKDVVVKGSESLQINPVAIDAAGNAVDLSGSNLEYSYSVTGTEYGNSIDENGLFTAGSADNVEGEHTIMISLQTSSQILETDLAVQVDLGAPRIDKVTVEERDLDSNMILTPQSQIEIVLHDGNGIESVQIYLEDGTEIPFSSQALATDVGVNAVRYSFTPEQEIPVGTHALTIKFMDKVGSSGERSYTGIKVYDALEVVGITRNYPNPFKPSVGTTLYYKLTQAASVKIYIYDLAGRLVYSTFCPEGASGGRADVNEVFWNGKNVFGEEISNGVYVYFVLSAKGKILTKGEMAAYE